MNRYDDVRRMLEAFKEVQTYNQRKGLYNVDSEDDEPISRWGRLNAFFKVKAGKAIVHLKNEYYDTGSLELELDAEDLEYFMNKYNPKLTELAIEKEKEIIERSERAIKEAKERLSKNKSK